MAYDPNLAATDRPEQNLLEKNLPEQHEWVDGQFVEKNGMTLKHGRIQGTLIAAWKNHKNAQNLGGEVYAEAPARTQQQIRRPDVAYLTPALMTQYGEPKVLPQSFPLITEIVSLMDLAEDVFSKANEYLALGCQDVWLVLPESQWMVVLTAQQRLMLAPGEMVSTQAVLPGFAIAVADLFG